MPEVGIARTRPKYLNLVQIRLPLAGFVSILHRVSGAFLFLFLPLLLWLFGASLGSAESFEQFRQVGGHPLAKLVLLGLLWSYLHHFCCGIRCLLLDMHIGVSREASRRSAVAVLAVSIPLTLILAGALLW
ncbi:MAG TPA: succinate dehydrogenase, cytochrome b556 subunit [Rhodocyclaceae bacterium]|nr:MAG: succinate dehydrogenase, cytochrome b556 subunit [Betaproteobacteria bacterium CG2_30_68_42]PIV76696.1 MAG: succinate dehydrogenase, cytochrome b556 subunit [Rhodocyclales bacterium CG17_big_fil_post_rev_8_21_14_2_50_68_7]PIX75834.1 MAG: succinate dehydrogenase, cytochrome b556 subunit [Rhodocyclales bacterium CG_4_10_14_3_um_filter_68_10]PJA58263.1 MAG: succinate dehydrogenase, cytochrome b556 subunit [Rhodocyclales bacterium CG_4_9_14_3_um_filter_68_10]HCX32612.1 succinate dehydrogena